MTQKQALAEFQAIFPERTELAVECDIIIGHAPKTRFYLWQKGDTAAIMASSERSWEHALALAKIKRDFPTEAVA